MRSADAADRFRIRRIIEQHAAAAVDLAVDEAGCEKGTAQIVCRQAGQARIDSGDDSGDPVAVDQHCATTFDAGRRQYARIDQRRRHHTVSVTLRRCGGMSGLRPRLSASALAAR